MSYPINRRDLIRIGATAALAALPGRAVFAAAQAPQFFTPAEFALLDEVTELMIPADDHSAGARAAKVAAYIDARVAESLEPEPKQTWRNGLKLLDDLSRKLHDRPFLEAHPQQRISVLSTMAKNEMDPKSPEEVFFGELKHATVHAYYTSKIGIHQEMEYKGNVMLKEFVGTEVQ
jgi:hypothetical protein